MTDGNAPQPPSAPPGETLSFEQEAHPIRRWLTIGAVLLAAGIGVNLLASHLARDVKVAPMSYGLAFYGTPKGPEKGEPEEEGDAADGSNATGADANSDAEDEPEEAAEDPESPQNETDDPADAEAEADKTEADDVPPVPNHQPLTGEQLEAIAEAFEPHPVGSRLRGTMVAFARYEPLELYPPAALVIVVPDESADRVIDPLVLPDDRGADAYLVESASAERVLDSQDVLDSATSARVAPLPKTARMLAQVQQGQMYMRPLFVRASSAARFGHEEVKEANVLFLELTEPGSLGPAVRTARDVREAHRLWGPHWKLHLAGKGLPVWLGALAQGLVLAAFAPLTMAAFAAVSGLTLQGTIGEWAVRSSSAFVAGGRSRWTLLVFMTGVAVAGVALTATGQMPPVVEGAAGIVTPGLLDPAATGGDVFDDWMTKWMSTVVLFALVLIGIPSLIMGLGLATATILVFGLAITAAPMTLISLDRGVLQAAVLGVEIQAYAAAAYAGYRVLVGVVAPRSVGLEKRRHGWAMGLEWYYACLPAVIVALAAASTLNAIFVGVLSLVG